MLYLNNIRIIFETMLKHLLNSLHFLNRYLIIFQNFCLLKCNFHCNNRKIRIDFSMI